MQIQFDRKDKIGEGMFGTVFRGKLNGRDVAVKRVELSKSGENANEENALRKLDHPNVIKFFHSESDADFKLDFQLI
jgi:serine/threonine protein kinase